MVLPSAEAIDFVIEPAAGQTVSVRPLANSVWPGGALSGVRERDRVVLGGGDGVAIEVERPEAGREDSNAYLYRLDRRRMAFPLAVGVCRATAVVPASAPAPAPAATSGGDISGFDPANWPRHCGLILSDGRRIRFRYQTGGPRGPAQMVGEGLWSGQPVTTRFAGVPSGTSHFGDRTGPAGTERMLGGGDIRAKVIKFTRIGDPSVTAQTGIGICGYNNIVRRPNQ